MLEYSLMALITWMFCGHIVALCSMAFLGVRPSMAKLLVALIAGPFSINKDWWLSVSQHNGERE